MLIHSTSSPGARQKLLNKLSYTSLMGFIPKQERPYAANAQTLRDIIYVNWKRYGHRIMVETKQEALELLDLIERCRDTRDEQNALLGQHTNFSNNAEEPK